MIVVLFDLFYTFFKIGFFTFGGGYAMLPLMQREFINTHQWLTQSEFIDIIAIAEMTPGPISINAATYVGYKVAGVLGSTFATLGLVTPSLLMILIIARLFKQFKSSPLVKGILSGIRPAVIALIFSAVFILGKSVLVEIRAVMIALAAFLLLMGGWLDPVAVILVSAVLGVLLY